MKRTLLFIFLSVFTCVSAQAKNYTPNDVYAEALLLEKNIKQWQAIEGKADVWIKIAVESNYHPRHVFQKAVVIIEKINRYRVNVLKVGAIPVNYPGGREITPNEVYNQVHRARQELLAMLKNINIIIEDTAIKQNITGKTPNDVYAKLKEISLALDSSLGLRGISPTDVYIASQQVVSIAKFLRRSQNLPINIPTIKRTKNKRPNHTLTALRALTIKINVIEKNLAMDPVNVIDVPKRVISPSDVYNALGIVFAELQRIQYHLGLERYFPQEPIKKAITSDDIIFNLNLAKKLLPTFLDKGKLQYYDRSLLIKTPDDVFSLTHYILKELYKFCRLKGIRIPPLNIPNVSNLTPQHTFTQGLEALEMIGLLRENQGLGLSATANYPLKEITPQEVFDLSLRIDEYLNMVFKESGMVSSIWITNEEIEYFYNKTPSDVYSNMWKINMLLEAILSNQGFNLNHLFQKADYLDNKLNILNSHLVEILTFNNKQLANNNAHQNMLYKKSENIGNKDLLAKTLYLKKLIVKIKAQQGISINAHLSVAPISQVKFSDIYRELWLIDASLSELELSLGIDKEVMKSVKDKDKDKDKDNFYQKLLKLEGKIVMLSAYLLKVNTGINE
jgi:hypothetical protein